MAKRQSAGPVARLALYSAVAEEAASLVIRRYSTSFGLASRLLGTDVRQQVENIYALARFASALLDHAKYTGIPNKTTISPGQVNCGL